MNWYQNTSLNTRFTRFKKNKMSFFQYIFLESGTSSRLDLFETFFSILAAVFSAPFTFFSFFPFFPIFAVKVSLDFLFKITPVTPENLNTLVSPTRSPEKITFTSGNTVWRRSSVNEETAPRVARMTHDSSKRIQNLKINKIK